MNLLRYGLVVAALVLAACGGSSGTTGAPIIGPTNPPTTSVGYSTSTLITSQSVARQSAAILPLASCQANQSPLAIQALDGYSTQSGGSWSAIIGNSVTATEYDASCKPLPTQAQYAIADATIASTASTQFALPSPAPGTVIITGHKHGATTIGVSFPDGSQTTIPVAVYDQMGVGCDNYYAGPQVGIVALGWSATTGAVPNAVDACGRTFSPLAPSDVYVDGSTSALDFPNGYQVVTGDQSALPGITSCSSFSSQGTQAGYGQGQVTLPALPNAPFVLLFKTGSGACVKVAVTLLISDNGAPTLVGLYAVSDANGKFAY